MPAPIPLSLMLTQFLQPAGPPHSHHSPPSRRGRPLRRHPLRAISSTGQATNAFFLAIPGQLHAGRAVRTQRAAPCPRPPRAARAAAPLPLPPRAACCHLLWLWLWIRKPLRGLRSRRRAPRAPRPRHACPRVATCAATSGSDRVAWAGGAGLAGSEGAASPPRAT